MSSDKSLRYPKCVLSSKFFSFGAWLNGTICPKGGQIEGGGGGPGGGGVEVGHWKPVAHFNWSRRTHQWFCWKKVKTRSPNIKFQLEWVWGKFYKAGAIIFNLVDLYDWTMLYYALTKASFAFDTMYMDEREARNYILVTFLHRTDPI